MCFYGCVNLDHFLRRLILLGLVSSVLSQAIGWEEPIAWLSTEETRPNKRTRLRNDLYCVRWGVKLYSNQTGKNVSKLTYSVTSGT